MNRKLTDAQIRATCRELLAADAGLSGRGLRAVLRRRFGYAGRTDRVFAIWRTQRGEQGSGDAATQDQELRIRLHSAEGRVRALEDERDRAVERAQRSEARELAHQDRWANEIHELRAAAGRLQREEIRGRRLQERVLQLYRERQELRARLAQLQAAH